LDGVSAQFFAGEIHAVLGENGAGKSTLMGVLGGFITPDSGEASFRGVPWRFGDPFRAKELGLDMVHQHFTLVPAFTVAENLALARLNHLGRVLDIPRLSRRAREWAADLGWEIDLDAKSRELPVGAQQRVEILKALSGDPAVLVLDEPTAVLSPAEVADLFRVLRRLRDLGTAVLLIAHKLSEVMSVADRVTVLRRGRHIATAALSETTAEQLATWMVGEIPPSLEAGRGTAAGPGIKVEDLVVAGDRGEVAIQGIGFQIGRGEVLAFGGVDGNGQVELAEALAGVRQPRQGSIRRESGGEVAYIPQDRREDGLALSLSVSDNMLIVGHRRMDLTWGPFLLLRKVQVWVRNLIERFQIVIGSPSAPVRSLSGGNQQKVVVSRALDRCPDLLIAVNPTRGLDLKATDYVHRKILEARDSGAVVALISADLDEIAALATRTVFLSRGKLLEGNAAAGLTGGAV